MAKVKKQWFKILAPDFLGKIELGETPARSIEDAVGRTLTIPLISIFPETDKFYMKLKFKIVGHENNVLLTRFIGHEVVREYISHIVRRGTSRVDNNLVVKLKSGERIRVKGILIFADRVNRNMKRKARKIMDNVVTSFAKRMNFAEFVTSMIDGTMAKQMRDLCKKIYPVSKVEIRKSEVISF